MFSPYGPGFQGLITNHSTPSTTPGTSITPGINDAKGSYTQILAATSDDAFGVYVSINSNNASANARPALVDIGVDPAGGTSYSVLIPDLNAACAISGTNGMVGHHYYFPLFIKAGSTVAARAQVGNATANTLRVVIRLRTKPKRPELMRVGSYVDAIGIDSANSRGTVITLGVSSAEGAYTSLGTLPRPGWWVQAGYSVDDGTMTAANVAIDLAIGASQQHVLISDMLFSNFGAEQINGELYVPVEWDLASGETLYARGSTNIATADSNNSVMAYVLGG